ncbi:ATP-binding cassette domain-containing protein [Arthrobacter sp. 24S4-2]|uniref:ATP-binding cassette domain-containing protein n=1 Tax=Arthrobacter sp. 24S4-2 TaxID=2575374 RepID=UPI001C2FC0F0|nr:ATP-binding cassette domain-containing protein [Arthrobacter sp. 24S4-2]
MPRRQRRQVVQSALEAVGLADQADETASTFSGGMIRRLELAQALVNAPQLLVLNEPTIGLHRLGIREAGELQAGLQRHLRGNAFLPALFLVAVLITGKPVLPKPGPPAST